MAAFSISPMGAGESVGAEVARAVQIVRDSGLAHRTDAMFTTVEGEWDEVMGVIRRCMDALLSESPRVSVVIKIDERPGVQGALDGKLASVEQHLGEGGRG